LRQFLQDEPETEEEPLHGEQLYQINVTVV
jgi:hypothetical protein